MTKRWRTGLAITGILVPMLGAPTFALALDSNSVDYFGHVAECINWLMTNPDKHSQFCSPSVVTDAQMDGIFSNGFQPTHVHHSHHTVSSMPPSTPPSVLPH